MAKIENVVIEFADIIKAHGIECNEELSPSNKLVKRLYEVNFQTV